MATKTRFEFTLEEGKVCHSCGRKDYVLVASIPAFPYTCVVCLFAMIDIPMEWRLSRTAIQTIAHREASAAISDEQIKMEEKLPPELRRKQKS